MDMPKPGDAHRKLAGFIGEWSGGETLHPSPWDPTGGTATATIVNRWIADGFAVAQDYEQRRGGKVNFRGHGVIWYDSNKHEYVMHWLDSMSGSNSEFRGNFDGDVLMLSAPMPGGGGHGRTVWNLGTPGAFTFSMDMSPDGANWKSTMEGKYRKAAAAGPVKKAAAQPAMKAAARKKAAPKKAAPKKAKHAAKKRGRKR